MCMYLLTCLRTYLLLLLRVRSHRLRAVRAQQVLRRPKVRPWSELEGKYMELEQRLSYDYVFKCVVCVRFIARPTKVTLHFNRPGAAQRQRAVMVCGVKQHTGKTSVCILHRACSMALFSNKHKMVLLRPTIERQVLPARRATCGGYIRYEISLRTQYLRRILCRPG